MEPEDDEWASGREFQVGAGANGGGEELTTRAEPTSKAEQRVKL